MAIYTQRGHIIQAIGNVTADVMQNLITDCQTGEIAQAQEPDGQPFDEAEFNEWLKNEVSKKATLEITDWEIPADGSSYVVAKYLSTEPVNFVVNGEVITVTPDDVWTAELEIAADAPGVIEISVKNHRAAVVATEVV